MFFLSRRHVAGRRPARVRPLAVSRPQVEALEERQLLSAGTLTPEFRVNTTTTRSQYEADTASALNGQSVVVWTDKSSSNSNPNIKAQLYDTRGGKKGSPFSVAAT